MRTPCNFHAPSRAGPCFPYPPQRDSKAYAVKERVVGTAMQEADQEKRDLGVFDALVAGAAASSW